LSHESRDHSSRLAALARRPASANATAVRRSFSEGAGAEGAEAAPFIAEWMARLTPRPGEHASALDVAMGRGRHAVALAIAGFRVFGVDARFDAVRDATLRASGAGVRVHGWCADLTEHPLPSSRFDVIVVTRYLQRSLFHALRGAVRPGGVVLYETFTTAQRALGTGPTSPDHLLEPGELLRAFDGFEVLFYEEVAAPEAVARIAARSLG
jgi:2-polyprenyl-3-methyl-5-hydroxy-6-metoxy-1,4-benzoquinol methylase